MVTEHAAEPAPPTLTISEPRDLVAVIPYLLGYHPSDTLVVIGLRGSPARARLTFRCDLAEDAAGYAADLAGRVAGALGAHGCDSALAAAYAPAVRATPCLDAVRAGLATSGITVREALRVTGGRYWSYLCADPDCCPGDGVPADPVRSPVAAAAVLSGLTAWRDRDQIRRYLAPVGGAQRERVRQATPAAEQRGAELRGRNPAPERDPFGAAFRTEGVRVVRAAIAAARRGALPTGPRRIAWLGVLLSCVRVRDEAWARIGSDAGDRTAGSAHVRLWRQVLRNVEPAYAAAPGSLLAVAAWHAGDRALAEAALDEVAREHPEYSMACLVRQALRSGAPPGGYEPTPEWLEQASPVAGTPGERPL
ncbi:hypothetical protein F4561_004077 [Lipingzhangella halophila]|uniref:DUF4192 domain-containing protein n=1 Tax=Lipingzhangella halophila TaxID=1783352 RepID=A0A7W7RJR6_9ACTN|nr:DUF4192 domain-containing protein [Lipingzhangella halophila]MBB4933257.1 hypothetical protein [Lipingzhangella halophila]